MIPRVEWLAPKFWHFGLAHYQRSTVLALGCVQLRWRKA